VRGRRLTAWAMARPLGQVTLQVLQFPPVNVIPVMIHTHHSSNTDIK
jgi:hypothetical protein